jgi:hypothetical protein
MSEMELILDHRHIILAIPIRLHQALGCVSLAQEKMARFVSCRMSED